MDPRANTNDRKSNQAFVETIVRLVLERLRSLPSDLVESPVIAADTVRNHPHQSLAIWENAIVTPAARDEAVARGLTIRRVGRHQFSGDSNTSAVSKPNELNQNEPCNECSIVDTDSAQRSVAVQAQLGRRSIRLIGATVVLSDRPAQAVFEQISAGRRAVMIAGIADVDRFSSELSPQVWVIDMQRMNIPATVNAIAKITQLGNPTT